MEKVITICGSGLCEANSDLYKSCLEMGRQLAEANFTICTGGYKGVMEAACKGAKSANGKTMGIIVDKWETKPNDYIDEIVKMPNLIERLTELIALGDGYIVLQGGSGTLVELSVILELMNKGLMREKPVIMISEFWKDLISILKIDSKRLSDIIDRNITFVTEIKDITAALNEQFEKQDKSFNYREIKGIKY